MVATCVRCHCDFKQLSKGRLFLLPPPLNSSEFMWGISGRLADHCYWLCCECSREHVVERDGTELVVRKRDQVPTGNMRPRGET